MGLTGAIVLYACFWFLILLLILPRGERTQLEDGTVVPGTPGGAPSNLNIRRKFLWTSVLALIPLAVVGAIFEFELLTMADFEFLFPASFLEEPAGRR